MTADQADRLLNELDAIHCALALAYEQPPHKKAAVRSLLHLAMVTLTSLKLALVDKEGMEDAD